jgi:hypothetical protein
MTDLSRRTFVALAAAVALKPVASEAKLFKCVEVQRPDGSWQVEPSGLRGVRYGQRFRMYNAVDNLGTPELEATADSDGESQIDSDQCVCGAVYYKEDTAVRARLKRFFKENTYVQG